MKSNTTENLRIFFADEKAGTVTRFIRRYKEGIRIVNPALIKKIIKPRPASGHKGTFGHALIIAGYEGTPGASILSSKAALKTGCGLLTAVVPVTAVVPLLTNLPEAMVIAREQFSPVTTDLSKFNAIGFGPGAGVGDESAGILYHLLNTYTGPLTIDADGLTILSRNKQWMPLLKSNVILTPHPVEFDRLTAVHGSALERLQSQIAFSRDHGVNILVKGQYTSIVTAAGIYFNTTGNSGMATAGSGDVLTGIITSLCAQGYDTGDAIILGPYLHGYAGDSAAEKLSMHSMIASDISDEIGAFFRKYEK